MKYIVAVYELDQGFGGSEEGGWWYTTGNLQYVSKVCNTREQAQRLADRMNHLYALQMKLGRKSKYWSAIYGGGHFEACVYEDKAPDFFPQTIPHYE